MDWRQIGNEPLCKAMMAQLTDHCLSENPDNKVHGANMGPTWGRQDPGWLHVGHVNLAIWEDLVASK